MWGKFTFILALLPVVVSAQPIPVQTTLICDKPEAIRETLKEYREVIISTSKSNQYDAGVSIWVSRNGTYTILAKEASSGLLCVIDHGSEFKLIYNGKAV